MTGIHGYGWLTLSVSGNFSAVPPIVEPPPAVESSRSAASVEVELRAMLAAGALELPVPGGGDTAGRWSALAAWGRGDLAVARLAEGHTDATAILAEAGRRPEPGAIYGVWAARSGGTGARLERSGPALRLAGTVRFCSGAHVVDRALVVADIPTDTPTESAGRLLVDVAIAPPGARPEPGTWRTAAMDAADTLDVRFDDLPVAEADVVGRPGWYTGRPGFALGGAGVAAVWWGGAAGLLDRVLTHLPAKPDAHQLAHLGELHALVTGTDALLARTAAAVDAAPRADHGMAVAEVRSAVEHVVRECLERVPRVLGPGPLSRDAELARSVADLGIYLRQHHGERDHAALGALVVERVRR